MRMEDRGARVILAAAVAAALVALPLHFDPVDGELVASAAVAKNGGNGGGNGGGKGGGNGGGNSGNGNGNGGK